MTAALLAGAGTIMLGCSPAKAAAAPPNITAAPTQIAHTALGDVGYREVGHGPTLLMITGFSVTMDDWAPYFVNALTQHFRVVVFLSAVNVAVTVTGVVAVLNAIFTTWATVLDTPRISALMRAA